MRNLGSWLALLALAASACQADATDDAAADPPTTPAPTTTAPTTTAPRTSTTPTTTTTTTNTTATNTPTTTTPTTTTTTTNTTTTTTTTTTTVAPVSPTTTLDGPAPRPTIGTAGDSMLLGMIPPFQRALERSGYDFRAQWFIGFLAGRDKAYWDEAIADPPDVLIVLFAPWELAALNRGDLDLGDPTWVDVYRRDFVEPALDRLRGRGTEVVWVGVPQSDDPVESQQYAFLNSIWRDIVEDDSAMTWLDGAPFLAGPDGGYADVDATVNPPVRLFQTDGRHLCPEGGRRLAEGVLALLADRFDVEVDPAWVDTDWRGNTAAYDHAQCG